MLRDGAALAEVLGAARRAAGRDGAAERALRFVGMLSLLCAVNAPDADARRCSLLVRKRAEITRDADAHELLDLPSDAPSDEARRALRRLAGSVHPDALGPDAPDALRRASGEVLAALADAAQALRANGG
jgi:hypothetical protein